MVLVRHGESVVTVDRVVGGPETCSGLSPLGVRQAEALRDRLAHTGELVDCEVLVASTMPRARETAEILAPALHGLPVQEAPDLIEHHPGEADGLSWDDFVDRYGVPDMERDPYLPFAPGSESLAEFHLRVGRALFRLASEHAGRTLVIACHGGVVDVAFRAFLRLPITAPFELHTLNTALTELVLPAGDPGALRGAQRWRLVRYNDAGHLAGLA
jgi:probable phosphoglycerate mutase